MKKTIVISVASIVLLASSASAIEQCDEWFKKNDTGIAGTMGKDGTGVVLDKNGEFKQVFASGVAFYQFDDNEEVADALKEAALKAKANISKYIKEEITSDESIEKISSKKKELSKNGSQIAASASKKTVKTQTMSIKSHSQTLLTGVIKVCESNSAENKEIQVVLAMSPKTALSASAISESINKNIGSRKSVDEYQADRIAGDLDVKSGVASKPTTAQSTTPENNSFSNKAKKLDF